jgi:hypothetical protein
MTEPFKPSGADPAAFMQPQGMMSMTDVSSIAGQADVVVKNVMRVEPMLAGMAGMFIPGLSLVQPWIVMMAPYLESALDDLSKGNNGDVLTSLIQLIQHVTKGQPNAPALSSPPVASSDSQPMGGEMSSSAAAHG